MLSPAFVRLLVSKHDHEKTRFLQNQRGKVATEPRKKPLNVDGNKLCGRPPQYAPAPCKLTFDILTLKVVYVSRVTWATSLPILAFLGLSVLDLGPMYATDRRQTRIIA